MSQKKKVLNTTCPARHSRNRIDRVSKAKSRTSSGFLSEKANAWASEEKRWPGAGFENMCEKGKKFNERLPQRRPNQGGKTRFVEARNLWGAQCEENREGAERDRRRRKRKTGKETGCSRSTQTKTRIAVDTKPQNPNQTPPLKNKTPTQPTQPNPKPTRKTPTPPLKNPQTTHTKNTPPTSPHPPPPPPKNHPETKPTSPKNKVFSKTIEKKTQPEQPPKQRKERGVICQ